MTNDQQMKSNQKESNLSEQDGQVKERVTETRGHGNHKLTKK